MKRSIELGVALLALTLFTVPRANADGIFTAILLGSNEVPPTGSSATGFIRVTLSGDALQVDESFSVLTAPAVAAHIHCCVGPGVNTGVAVPFPGFPSATSGTYSILFDLTDATTYNAPFLTAHGGTAAGAESALVDALFAGEAYANIHDTEFPGGEIRGQLTAQTPEPSSLMLLSVALSVLVGLWKKAPKQVTSSRP
jgi:hypothetical protein